MAKQLLVIWGGLLLVGLIGCGESVDDLPEEDVSVSGMHLTVGAPGYSDVTHMEYTVYRIAALADGTCPENLKKPPEGSEILEGFPIQKPLKENMTLPMDDIVEASPFKEGSEHRFADLLHYTDAGCYFVYIQPEQTIDGEKEHSDDCLPTYGTIEVTSASKKKDDKKKGITEVVFISQCPGVQDKSVVLENIASVTSDEVDVNPENNTDTAAVTVERFGMCCESFEKCCESSDEYCDSSEEEK